jgi:hypothetical protein
MRDTKVCFCAGFAAAMIVGAVAAVSLDTRPAQALEQPAGEKDALKDCEQRLCDIVINKQTSGDDLSCPISKTWLKDKIKDGVAKKRMTWAFGDARCTVDLSAKRDTILGAVTKPEHDLELAPHTVKCEIERDNEVTAINISLAPKIAFKNGKAEKAWLNLKSIEGPAVVRGAIWTAAQLEDTFGVFHGDMIKEINEFVEEKCPKALAKK